ncbi:NADPH2:quinone reductase [Mesorhizobium albiziae]|uniref:NADPH2:quinone reductase n=1 Tax=Neomesorhizobium albiziae TaxID=335020 RepID=A0A1I4ETP6_9HYPH|nr:NADPH:quinone reductase [Mesorhizobium albiziae]GLS32668.1 NADPH:quinone oxidoreductase [Mesorhizobium albiziae]SFL09064.1 NADPH2:quinone reductase [Mesorhizobium albiziae]
MRAAWYEKRGAARDVLVVGELPDPNPGEGEVRIRLAVSGISPGDVKKRSGWQGAPMPYPRVIPHSDGAGVIDAVGLRVSEDRLGQRVWCYGAQSYRPFGTAAEMVVVPVTLAVRLLASSAGSSELEMAEQAACLGIAGITAHRAIFADGPVAGKTVLVHGAAGGVGSIAVQLARWDGAQTIAIVRDPSQRNAVAALGANHVFVASDPDLVGQIRQVAPDGVHRIAEVDFASHIELDAAVIAVGGVISSYYSSQDRPEIPYWQLGFADVTLRLLGSDDFPPSIKDSAARELTYALAVGALRVKVATRLSLEEIASAHELVERGVGGRVVIDLARQGAALG